MGKVDYFSIVTEKPNAIYNAGEIIRGNLIIKIKEKLKINYVRMLLKGFARVHWTETHVSGESTTTISYYAYDEYLHYNMIFLEKKNDNDCYLEVGDYSYPFEIKLPLNLPTSFEYVYGRIRYSLNGEIDIPWSFNKNVFLNVTVINPVDLNLMPMLRQPATLQDSKTFCCWCCKSDPIIATLKIFKGGYVPGETVLFNAIIDNKSTTAIKNVSIQLVQNIILHATNKTETFHRILSEFFFDGKVDKQSYKEWNNGKLSIPPVNPSTNKTCRLIEVYYSITLSVNPEGPSFRLNVSIPITIGTIPFITENADQQIRSNYELSKFELTRNTDLDEKKDGDVTYMNSSYTPSYPYYKDFSIYN